MKWKTMKLDKCCLSIADGDHQPPPKAPQGIPFVTISNVNSFNEFDFSNTKYVPEEYYKKLDVKRKAQPGDVLYSVVGSFGIPLLIKDSTPFVFQRHIAILRPDPNIIRPAFLYYTMKSRDFYAKADAVALGTAQRTVSLTSLRNFEIEVPSVEQQDSIVKSLSSYDKLISNNQKQIKLLEEAAQRLYKEWFVHLRFPGFETTPITDGVPEGWDVDIINNLIAKTNRTKQIKTNDYLSFGSIPIIDQSKKFIAGYTNDDDCIVDLGTPAIVFGDHTRILKYIQFPFAKGADGTQIIVSNHDRLPQSLFYYSLCHIDLSNYHYARHFKYLKAESILIPTKGIADAFDDIVSPILAQIQLLRYQSYYAMQSRDKLLPKLMRGKIEV